MLKENIEDSKLRAADSWLENNIVNNILICLKFMFDLTQFLSKYQQNVL